MVSIALKTLFGFGHIQSDDIKAKKTAPIFVKKVVEELRSHDVVIADRFVLKLIIIATPFLTNV